LAEQPLEVRILHMRRQAIYRGPDEVDWTIAITFRHGDLPPLTVWIPEKGYSVAARDRAIRTEVQRYLTERGKTVKVA